MPESLPAFSRQTDCAQHAHWPSSGHSASDWVPPLKARAFDDRFSPNRSIVAARTRRSDRCLPRSSGGDSRPKADGRGRYASAKGSAPAMSEPTEKQASNLGEWRASRVVHLHGGLRAVNDRSPAVHLSPRRATKCAPKVLALSTYGVLFSELSQEGFDVLGCDFVSRADQLLRREPPQWLMFGGSKAWVIRTEHDAWSGIAHAAAKDRDPALGDLARRIQHHFRVCEWRLWQLSDAYHDLLIANLVREPLEYGKWQLDEWSWRIYAGLESFFTDACILRDRFAEFASQHVFSKTLGTTKVRQWEPLRKALAARRSMIQADPLADQVLKESEGQGWIKELGAYRDLSVHGAPLIRAAGHMYYVVDEVVTRSFGPTPVAHCPLPPAPTKLLADLSKGAVPDTWQGAGAAYADSGKGIEAGVDSLRFAHSRLVRLAQLSSALISRSPVKPHIPTIKIDADLSKFGPNDRMTFVIRARGKNGGSDGRETE
jgi:hypothetical protein